MAKSPDDMAASMIANLKEKNGQDFASMAKDRYQGQIGKARTDCQNAENRPWHDAWLREYGRSHAFEICGVHIGSIERWVG